MFKRINSYLSLVKFAHTVFALPFAMMSYTYAIRIAGGTFTWGTLLEVLVCMVSARNVAMGFNRWADRKIDALNPRTASREIPAGVVSPSAALWFVAINAIIFILLASAINSLCAMLSVPTLIVLMGYSYCKRFTSAAHLVLGLSLGIAPAGAFIAATGTLSWPPCLLSALVLTWCAGFDIIYALQDRDYDIEHGLHSIPSRFSVRTSLYISCFLHSLSILFLILFCLELPQGAVLWTAEALFTGLVLFEHLLVTPSRQRSIPIAFGTLNGLASLTLATLAIVQMFL